MNKLTTEKRAAILTALVEGNSVNSTARICNCSKVTVLRLLADASVVCRRWHHEHVRNLQSERVQCDEVWSFVGAKDKAVRNGAAGHGSAWLWVGMDSDSKLAIAYHVGAREQHDARCFMQDLASRLANRVQLSTDGLPLYENAVLVAFGWGVDYAKVIKTYANPTVEGKYSPGICIGCEKQRVIGWANSEDVSTSHIERQNLHVRMASRRFTRLTNAFSKRMENHRRAVDLHYWAYNWNRRHQTLKTTPAAAAGIANRRMLMVELAEHIETQEAAIGGRLTSYLPSPSK